MTFWETFAILSTTAGLFALILGAWLTYAARKNGEATRSLMEHMEKRPGESMERVHRETLEVLKRMDEGADKRHLETFEVLERMDRRADERHKEVIAVIQALGRA